MHRPSKARRRFHTDRIVRSRRTRYFRVHPDRIGDPETERRLSYGRLASKSPWDCGNPACGVCHPIDFGRRHRETREWRVSWNMD